MPDNPAPVSFDELLRRVGSRLDRYHQTQQADVVRSDEALVEARALLTAAGDDQQRMASARHAAGWLHFFRHVSVGVSPKDLATAIVMLGPFETQPDVLPPPMRSILGPAADVEDQIRIATALTTAAAHDQDEALVLASVGLFDSARATLGADDPRVVELNHGISMSMRHRHKRTQDPADLRRAIELGESAIAATPDDDPKLPGRLHNLCLAMRDSYDRTADPADLSRAIELGRRSIASVPDDHKDRLTFVSNLGGAYRQRYDRSGDPADLDQSIALGEEAVGRTPADHPARPIRLSTLSLALGRRYDRSGTLADLERMVTVSAEAVDAATPGSGERANNLNNLASALVQHHARTGDPADPDRAIAAVAEALNSVGPRHPDRPLYLTNAAAAFRQRYARTGELDDLANAINAGERAIAEAPADHWELGLYLTRLGETYVDRYARLGEIDDLARGIELEEAGLARTSARSASRYSRQTALSGAYTQRYERTGDPADLDRAIDLRTSALELSFEEAQQALLMANLGRSHATRYERGGDPADLERAIALGDRAVALTPDDHPALATRCVSLGVAYGSRYEANGDPADLDRAIELGERCVVLIPADSPQQLAMPMSNLSYQYRLRYERTGELADLDRAISLGNRAIAMTPPEQLDRATTMANVSGAYQRRYEHVGVLADLDWALEIGRQAVDATPPDHVERPRRLVVLASAHLYRYSRTDDPSELTVAVDLGEQAMAALPADAAERPLYLNNVGQMYRRLYRESEDLADLLRAIELSERAVATARADRPTRAGYLGNLSGMYRMSYDRLGELPHLRRAVDLARESVDDTPDGHPELADRLVGAAWAMVAWFRAGQSPTVDITGLTGRLAAASTSTPDDLVNAYTMFGQLAFGFGDVPEAMRLLDTAVGVLPTIVPRAAADWTDQEHRLGEHAGLVSEAIAAHCAAGDPAGAVEVAEQGRGILLANHLESRTDLGALLGQHPELAIRLGAVQARLNRRTAVNTEPLARVTAHDDRRRLWDEYDALVADIRKHDGWGDFLLPPRLAELRGAAADGAVLLVSAGRMRSDAIIVTADAEPVSVPLPELRSSDVENRALALLEATHDQRQLAGTMRRQRVVPELLAWLWDTVVAPVLAALPGDSPTPPRVWWLPAGVLGLFPLHAAGRPGEPGALDTVVSSYTPTLRALRHARERPPASHRRQLVVALNETPGQPDLPGTVAEADGLAARYPGIRPLWNRMATRNGVLAELPNASWAHFACHAAADLAAPSRGGLSLHDGVLPVHDITQLHLPHAELAYLSACSTALRGWQHADESIHLASAFQLAGFRHVIASLWPLDDATAADAARAFYQRVGDAASGHDSAGVLRDVTLALRADEPHRPDRWAALIHSGP